jgi:hypothetical protein
MQDADKGDTTTIQTTLPEAAEQHPWRPRQTPLRSRDELLERPCGHLYETGALRRAHLHGQENVLKRLLVHHASAFNLGLLMR